MISTKATSIQVLGLLAALFLLVGCSSSDSESVAPSDAAAATEAIPSDPAPTDPESTEPAIATPTSDPSSGTSCTAADLAPALGLPAESVFEFECKDGYAGVDFESPNDYDATVILSSDDGKWSQVDKSVCENDGFPTSIKKNYCDVS
ncbi:MAG: hypothetical protein CMH41_10090 [Micrococcales bacterium]|nr:hypothetical protein [Micrococcales bacterium]